MAEKVVEEQLEKSGGKKKRKGKGSKVSSFVLGIVNAIVFVFTILMYVLVSKANIDVDNAAAIFAIIILYCILYVFPLLFSIANIAIGIPGIITGVIGLKRSEKKGFALAALIINVVVIVGVITLFSLTYLAHVIAPAVN